MNLLKRSASPSSGGHQQPPTHHHQQQQASGHPSTFATGRLTPSPHFRAASTPGSPHTTPHVGASSLLLRMGGENSAFRALGPGATAVRRLSGYTTDSDEEINVNDESEEERMPRSRSSSPVEVVDTSPSRGAADGDGSGCQPLQLTKHDRD